MAQWVYIKPQSAQKGILKKIKNYPLYTYFHMGQAMLVKSQQLKAEIKEIKIKLGHYIKTKMILFLLFL